MSCLSEHPFHAIRVRRLRGDLEERCVGPKHGCQMTTCPHAAHVSLAKLRLARRLQCSPCVICEFMDSTLGECESLSTLLATTTKGGRRPVSRGRIVSCSSCTPSSWSTAYLSASDSAGSDHRRDDLVRGPPRKCSNATGRPQGGERRTQARWHRSQPGCASGPLARRRRHPSPSRTLCRRSPGWQARGGAGQCTSGCRQP